VGGGHRAADGGGPGQRFAYNQTNYVLLARIIAQQSGMPYERFLATGQFSSARMARTTFGDSYDLIPDVATMYSLAPRATDAADAPPRLSHWFYDIPPSLWAGGGILTTADDTARWLVALTEGRLLQDAPLRRMWPAERLTMACRPMGGGWPVLRIARPAGGRYRRCALGLRGLSRARRGGGGADQSGRCQSQQFIPRIADLHAPAVTVP
jgi:CubicO group peptidase (beta-lactamase class C family)